MSNRDDSFMYSGINSVSAEPRTPREAQKESKKLALQKLKPGAEVLLEMIAKEKANVIDLRTIVIDRTTTEQEMNTELLARKLYLSHLNSLETKIKNITKQPKEKTDE